jgi:hypothetical protein
MLKQRIPFGLRCLRASGIRSSLGQFVQNSLELSVDKMMMAFMVRRVAPTKKSYFGACVFGQAKRRVTIERKV